MTDFMDNWDLPSLAESCELECKAAQGRDGQGELPEDFWKTYSAMANTEGGVILLGVREKPPGQFRILGLANVERVRKALWDNLNNRKQISINLLTDRDVAPVEMDGKIVLRIQVPRATRQQRPVHLGSNPLGGTYLRRHEGDYVADDEQVRRLLAERVEDSRDERVLRHFSFSDLDMETVAAYRNRFAAVKPGHPWSDLPVHEFLERIGAYGKNREQGYEGLRLAGLLMFGRAEVIWDVLPYYMLDYQERPEAKTERRWIDRVTPDGTWSGNVYDFFRKVYAKLTAGLKVPFEVQDGQRIEDTPVHQALREALVNTLIHADFSGRMSVLVVKRPDMFGFRNPGLMRIPLEQALEGGHSDCRNRRLQTMFQLVGYGDKAGSGVPGIYKHWSSQSWRRPLLYQLTEPEQTRMELRMSSLLPEDAVAQLQQHLPMPFADLPESARLALVTAQLEGSVSHDRLKQICVEHRADLTKMLGQLVRDGLLTARGAGRGTVYYLAWQQNETDAFLDAEPAYQPTELTSKPTELTSKPTELTSKPTELTSKPTELTSKPTELPLYQDWAQVPAALQARLLSLAEPVTSKRKVSRETLQSTILILCQGHYLGLRVLVHALGRNSHYLRQQTLALVQTGRLQAAYAASRDPRQAYTTATQP